METKGANLATLIKFLDQAFQQLSWVDAFRDSMLVMTIMPFVAIGHRNIYFHIFQYMKTIA